MAKVEPLLSVADGVHALPGAVNSVIIEGPDRTAVLVDTGQDADAGRRTRRALEQLALTPTVIINTHAHADHFGGNAYLLRQFPELEVVAPEFEANIIRAPFLEPVYLFHGASPLAELCSKWLQAPQSPVQREIDAGEHELGGVQLRLLDVRGHAHRQLAVQVDDFLFAADAVFGDDTLARYPLPFAQDVSAQLASFDVVAGSVDLGVKRLLPGHGALSGDVAAVVARNRDAVEHAAQVILTACEGAAEGATTEDVLASTASRLELGMTDLPRYHLNLCTVSAYLAHLRFKGLVEPVLDAGRLRWRRAD